MENLQDLSNGDLSRLVYSLERDIAHSENEQMAIKILN